MVNMNEQIATNGFSPDNVVNIDETNIQFDMTSSVTLANLGSRTLIIWTICSMYHSVGGNLIWQEVAPICHIQRNAKGPDCM